MLLPALILITAIFALFVFGAFKLAARADEADKVARDSTNEGE